MRLFLYSPDWERSGWHPFSISRVRIINLCKCHVLHASAFEAFEACCWLAEIFVTFSDSQNMTNTRASWSMARHPFTNIFIISYRSYRLHIGIFPSNNGTIWLTNIYFGLKMSVIFARKKFAFKSKLQSVTRPFCILYSIRFWLLSRNLFSQR